MIVKEQEARAAVQDRQYEFPYHYIPSAEGGFRQIVFFRSGYEYQSYLEFVLAELDGLKWRNLLDVGCGDGRLVYELGRRFPDRACIGIDLSERAIRQAQAMNPSGHYMAGDVRDRTMYTRRCDVVTLIEVLEHVPPPEIPDFLAGIRQRLNASGLLLLTVPSSNQRLIKKHYQHFSIETLTRALTPHFSIVRHHYLNRRMLPVRLIENALMNPLFVFRERHTLAVLMAMYRRFCLHATPRDGRRIVALCRPA